MQNIGVVSCGSIGERYIKILKQLNCNVIAWNRGTNRQKKIQSKYKIKVYKNLSHFFDQNKFDAVFICSPNNLHISHANKASNFTKKIFIEKPLSNSNEGLNKLTKKIKKKKIITHISCNFRFHRAIKVLKKILQTKKYGEIISSRFWCYSYLPDWHPKENYKTMYSAKKNLGGGALMDFYHEFDLLYWFFGKEQKIISSLSKSKLLKIETEEYFDAIVKFKKFQVNLHCNYIQKPFSRGIIINFEKGSLRLSLDKLKITFYNFKQKKNITILKFKKNELQNMYKSQIRYFLKTRRSMSSLKTALNVHRMMMSVKKNK